MRAIGQRLRHLPATGVAPDAHRLAARKIRLSRHLPGHVVLVDRAVDEVPRAIDEGLLVTLQHVSDAVIDRGAPRRLARDWLGCLLVQRRHRLDPTVILHTIVIHPERTILITNGLQSPRIKGARVVRRVPRPHRAQRPRRTISRPRHRRPFRDLLRRQIDVIRPRHLHHLPALRVALRDHLAPRARIHQRRPVPRRHRRIRDRRHLQERPRRIRAPRLDPPPLRVVTVADDLAVGGAALFTPSNARPPPRPPPNAP